ncbi:MAG: hypothetical protein LC115_03810 [Bacteroidia bacterium]|nr:hypothetical protein [Bacteroidia bacterium]
MKKTLYLSFLLLLVVGLVKFSFFSSSVSTIPIISEIPTKVSFIKSDAPNTISIFPEIREVQVVSYKTVAKNKVVKLVASKPVTTTQENQVTQNTIPNTEITYETHSVLADNNSLANSDTVSPESLLWLDQIFSGNDTLAENPAEEHFSTTNPPNDDAIEVGTISEDDFTTVPETGTANKDNFIAIQDDIPTEKVE